MKIQEERHIHVHHFPCQIVFVEEMTWRQNPKIRNKFSFVLYTAQQKKNLKTPKFGLLRLLLKTLKPKFLSNDFPVLRTTFLFLIMSTTRDPRDNHLSFRFCALLIPSFTIILVCRVLYCGLEVQCSCTTLNPIVMTMMKTDDDTWCTPYSVSIENCTICSLILFTCFLILCDHFPDFISAVTFLIFWLIFFSWTDL